MIATKELVSYIDSILQPEDYQDYSPNGLQVEGSNTINKLITGVTASQELLDAAVFANADAILVHHGYFWKGDDPLVVGIKRNRLYTLLANEINLLAYHLPLDFHSELGNNAQLANLLGIKVLTETKAFFTGELALAATAADFSAKIAAALKYQPLHIAGPQQQIKSIAWSTGAAQAHIAEAAEQGVDAYLTGEISERAVYVAREMGIHLFAAGHYATERYGVQALGAHLAEKFGIEHQFIEIDNPV